MNEKSLEKMENEVKIEDSLIITDPKEILIVLHDQRKQILNELLHTMKNIQELSEATHLNPGTVKRNLEELMSHGYVFIAAVRQNDYKMTMKYYQAKAKQIIIKYSLPE
jgi:predicted transcriptional regulator